MTQQIYKSSTMGDIPLSAKGKALMQNLRGATRAALREPTGIAEWTLVSNTRGEIAKYMSELEKTVENFFKAPPSQMSTPLGLLPVNSEGMRRVVDELVRERNRLEEEGEENMKLQHQLQTVREQAKVPMTLMTGHGNFPISADGMRKLQDTLEMELTAARAGTQTWIDEAGRIKLELGIARKKLEECRNVAQTFAATVLGVLPVNKDETVRLARELSMARDVIQTYRNSGAKPSPYEHNSEVMHMSVKQLFEELAKRF